MSEERKKKRRKKDNLKKTDNKRIINAAYMYKHIFRRGESG